MQFSFLNEGRTLFTNLLQHTNLEIVAKLIVLSVVKKQLTGSPAIPSSPGAPLGPSAPLTRKQIIHFSIRLKKIFNISKKISYYLGFPNFQQMQHACFKTERYYY